MLLQNSYWDFQKQMVRCCKVNYIMILINHNKTDLLLTQKNNFS